MQKKSISTVILIISALTIMFTFVACTPSDSAETATPDTAIPNTSIMETVSAISESTTTEEWQTEPVETVTSSVDVATTETVVSTISETTATEKSSSPQEEYEVPISIEEDISQEEIDSNSYSVPIYARCISDTTVIKSDCSEDSLFQGEIVCISEYDENTEVAIIEWYNSKAIVDIDCLWIYPEDYVPDFASDSFAGCIVS